MSIFRKEILTVKKSCKEKEIAKEQTIIPPELFFL